MRNIPHLKRSYCMTFFSLLFFLNPHVSLAQEGGHVGGGTGEEKHHFIKLADLLKKTCSIKTVDSAFKRLKVDKEVNEVLSALHHTHAYMAYQIRNELAKMEWCLTESELVRVKTLDDDSLLASYHPMVQVAIRDISRKRIYLSLPNFRKMKANPLMKGDHLELKMNQAMLIIHEVIHTFVPLDLPKRNDGLRSLTKAIYENYAKENSPADLDLALKWAGAQNLLETTVFSAGFTCFVSPKECTIGSDGSDLMADTVINPSLAFNILINDFGRADFVAKLSLSHPSRNILPPEFHFNDLLDIFTNDPIDHGKQRDIFEKTIFTLGGCQVTKRLISHQSAHWNDIFAKVRYHFSYEFIPNHGMDLNHRFELSLKEEKTISNYSSSVRKGVAQGFQSNLRQTLMRINQGACNTRPSNATEYLK